MADVLSPVEIARVAYQAGFRGQALTTAVAVSLAESSGNAGAIGDVGLEGGEWGPSVGLWQIRSLTNETGTGDQRDAKANVNPLTAARHAFQISDGGKDFGPWSTYTNGAYQAHLAAAEKAEKAVTANPPTGKGGTGVTTVGERKPRGGGSGSTTIGGPGGAVTTTGGRGSGSTTIGGSGDGSKHHHKHKGKHGSSAGSGVTTVGYVTGSESKRVEIDLPEMKALAGLLEQGHADVVRSQSVAQEAVTELQAASKVAALAADATPLVALATELNTLLGQLVSALAQDHQLVSTTHTKATQVQSGPLAGVLKSAGLPPGAISTVLGGDKGGTKKSPEPKPVLAGHGTDATLQAQEKKVVDAAKSFLGVPYVYGGDNRSGVDCSGLTSLAYKDAFGKDIGRDTTAQLQSGKTVGKDGDWALDRKLLQPGDLIFYGEPGAGGPNAHVVMYIGDGKVIQAPYHGQPVQISPLFESASSDEPFVGVRRYLTGQPTHVA